MQLIQIIYTCTGVCIYMYVYNNLQLIFFDLNSDEEQFQFAVQPQKLPTTITSLIMGIAYNNRNSHQHV